MGLSPSAFHSHFRSTTALRPLQFQKGIRLNEGRRLILAERLAAATAAFEVGYESPSQFSREYGRLSGLPPMRDIKKSTEVSSAQTFERSSQPQPHDGLGLSAVGGGDGGDGLL